MKHVVSVSLGSRKRDFREEVEFLGERVLVERLGTDGDLTVFAQMISDLDGKVDAIGIGGTDLYLRAGERRYMFRDIGRAVAGAKTTPIVDGGGLKDSIERETVRYLQEQGLVDFAKDRTLIVMGVDRFGLAEEVAAYGGPVIFGDVMFALGLPIPLRKLPSLHLIARLVLPVLSRLPFKWYYPTGKAQEEQRPKFARYFQWADVIAGDFHYIRRHVPERLDGKTIISNTTREDDVRMLRERGVKRLVTSTPEIAGKSPGTNVFEAIVVALEGRRPEEMAAEDYMTKVREMGWKPRVVELG